MNVVVIGGGPAGMMAAGMAAKSCNNVILLEKNEKLGKKLAITGKGRCNVTNNCVDINELIRNIPRNGKFMYSSIRNFGPSDVIEFFEKLGVSLKIERGNRVFPCSDRAMDIVSAMEKFLCKRKVNILHKRAVKIVLNNGQVSSVITTDGTIIDADAVVICTGGKSYPKTGSTGDGYDLAKNAGHTIVPVVPSLVPLVSHDERCEELQGLSLKNVAVKLVDGENNKIIYDDFGEMLFTHFGVSGPVVLSASANIDFSKFSQCSMIIDLKPALSFEQLDKRIIRDFQKNLHKNIINSLNELLPKKMIPVMVNSAKIPFGIKCENVTRQMRFSLVGAIKNFAITIDGARPIDEAIVTRGGVSVKEIFPSTMESRIVKGLFFAGEVVDVDAYTGGFNLQVAFSTGYTAGNCISKLCEV